jgi:hypothetical protein
MNPGPRRCTATCSRSPRRREAGARQAHRVPIRVPWSLASADRGVTLAPGARALCRSRPRMPRLPRPRDGHSGAVRRVRADRHERDAAPRARVLADPHAPGAAEPAVRHHRGAVSAVLGRRRPWQPARAARPSDEARLPRDHQRPYRGRDRAPSGLCASVVATRPPMRAVESCPPLFLERPAQARMGDEFARASRSLPR